LGMCIQSRADVVLVARRYAPLTIPHYVPAKLYLRL
jgi:hypothetical protein